MLTWWLTGGFFIIYISTLYISLNDELISFCWKKAVQFERWWTLMRFFEMYTLAQSISSDFFSVFSTDRQSTIHSLLQSINTIFDPSGPFSNQSLREAYALKRNSLSNEHENSIKTRKALQAIKRPHFNWNGDGVKKFPVERIIGIPVMGT